MKIYLKIILTFNWLLITGNSHALLIIPIPNLSVPPAFQKIIDAYEASKDTKAIALASEDKVFGAKYWVIGHYSGVVTQEVANQIALNSCEDSLKAAKSQMIAGQPLYNFGDKKCELYTFKNQTLSAPSSNPSPPILYGNRDLNKNIETDKNIPIGNSDFIKRFGSKAVDKKVALIIGNADYRERKLDSPINDARMIGGALKELNFEVTIIENATKNTLDEGVKNFINNLKDKDSIGLFYFAGHGVQSDGANYILPIDVAFDNSKDIERTGFNIQFLLNELRKNNNQMNMLILDACRDNPFSAGGRNSGLAAIDGPPGTFVAFSTAPGKVALENSDHGIYTRNLLNNINIPGIPIEQVFKKVRAGVLTETNGQQVPWENTALLKDFYFSYAKFNAGFKRSAIASESEEWDKVDKNNLYELIEFYRNFRKSQFESDLIKHVNINIQRLYPGAPLLIAADLPGLLYSGHFGAEYDTLNAVAAEYLGYPKKSAVRIKSLDSGGDAEKAGAMIGDVLVSVNGENIETIQDLLRVSKLITEGEEVFVKIWRRGAVIEKLIQSNRPAVIHILTNIAGEHIFRSQWDRAKLFANYLFQINDPKGSALNGLLYYTGQAGPKDIKMAEASFLKASTRPLAAAFLAEIYLTPGYNMINDSLAYKYALQSAEGGDPRGAALLSIVYFKGSGTERNFNESVKWARISAESGNATGMFLLGARYEDGFGGLERNIEAAKIWYRRARDLNSTSAKSALQRLGE